jgi:hypothetical protein
MIMRLKWWKNFRRRRKVTKGNISPAHLTNLLPGVYYRMELSPECQITHLGPGISDLLGHSEQELLNRNTIAYLRIAHPEHEEILLQKQMLCRQSRQTKAGSYFVRLRHYFDENPLLPWRSYPADPDWSATAS